MGSIGFAVIIALLKRQQLLIEAADFPRAVHEVNLQNPVPFLAELIHPAHPARIVGVNVQGDLVAGNALVWKLAHQVPGNLAAKFPKLPIRLC